MTFARPRLRRRRDFDFLTYAIGTPPENGTATATFGGIQYTPDAGFTGTDTFTYVANDGIEELAARRP